MNAQALLIIFFRWLHVITAMVAFGGLVFIRLILPVGLKVLEPELAMTVLLRCRRVFKIVIHSSILLFLISGTYNAMTNWGAYKNSVPLSHAFIGVHVLLALVVFGIALFVLAGKQPPKNHRKLMLINIVLLLLAVAAASTLKWVREHPTKSSTPAIVMQ